MVERGQPRKCQTNGCPNGTHDETQLCATCRRLNRILNEIAGQADDQLNRGTFQPGGLITAPPITPRSAT
ncbi:hypothetical protein CH302_01005 [Rhodococcus sp. 15-2388-1-1a]|uniref:hypothetical protein n=1 Tax=Nocardiaceae TaxID=85025 RepID=UPI00055F31A7|nr:MULTISPECIES: hypothetical protein [Rhodococcus]OZF05233.1 hypothetical protein CH302_01005 [Rhodococcus sp. 15-2388-1-1a]